MKRTFVVAISAAVRVLVPLPVRKRLVLALARFNAPDLYLLTFLLLKDFSQSDASGFHRFLWSNHLGHAETYDIARRFGPENVERTRLLIFLEICATLQAQGIDPGSQVDSVLDVGCSVGHVLRHVEEQVFHAATTIHGVDVDAHAINAGSAYLRQLGSKAELTCADLGLLDKVLERKNYDVILCLGVLMYVDEATARRAVKTMLQHSRVLVALSTWPHPSIDNAALSDSVPATQVVSSAPDLMDGVLIHNLDEMVRSSGGRVLSRRWTGSQIVEGDKPLYFVLAETMNADKSSLGDK